MGPESYFRKIICASIVVKSNTGISWLSEGAWRDEWWSKSDSIVDSYKQWTKEDSRKEETRLALAAFTKDWIAIAPTDEERSAVLQALYITDLKDALEVVAGEDAYHSTHSSWHQVFRAEMLTRNYYDIFMFDMKGNCIYSVFKESDYATNFGTNTNLPAEFRKWQDSGLGEAFRGALAAPDEVTMTPWTPYGPSAGALASFLASGVKNENGELIGVYSTQMPPNAMSIEVVEPDCTLQAITKSFEGAINFVGLGQPLAANMEGQVPCFKGRTAERFLELLNLHLTEGYPLGDSLTQVADPYHDIKAHAVDGTCVFAYALRHLMAADYSLHDIREHTPEAYAAFLAYIKTEADFSGVSGKVKFSGNDKPAFLAVQQIQDGKTALVGTTNGTSDLTINGGPSNASWKPAHPDMEPQEEDFPFFIFQIVLPFLCICCPGLAACLRNI
jgi:hypothetical protein